MNFTTNSTMNNSTIEDGFSFMPSSLARFIDNYNYLMVDLRDPRADAYPMMWSIWPTVILILCYVYFVKVLGPRMMADRKPYELKGLMLAYNLFQTLLSFWGFTQGWRFFVTGDYSWKCQPVDYSMSSEGQRALMMGMVWYYSKWLDMFDSIFFVLKKKFTHLSFLHVFHHGIMPINTWGGARFVGGGHGGFCAFLNAGVHTVMYLYYFLSAWGPGMQRFLWWKKYLTTLQIVQFVCVFCHGLLPLYFVCDYPQIMPKVLVANAVVFFILFANFYFFAYMNRKPKSEEKKL